ncbi:MAG: L-rhamnose isomerase [Planctomycetia bacterium]|nr:L-rhamnose isomerase [Planctomycetia bacterium]
MSNLNQAFELAKERYAEIGVDVDAALEKLATIKISLQCWQGDDVCGFESTAGLQGGGILATGNYFGKARTPEELRDDANKAFSLIPGKHRLSIHAIYLDNGGKFIDRDEIEPVHFQGWIDWAKANGLGLDFNTTFFSHAKAADGFTLSSANEEIRKFWVRHGICCRNIAEEMGKQLGTTCILNHWMPDGYKDIPADRLAPRKRMEQSLDEICARPIDPKYTRDAVECKLFGISSESYVVGSHEFFMGYAIKNKKILTLDSGHFHPTETISDKLSSISLFVDEILLHVSRGVRWDSDHVVIWNDDLKAIGEEIVRNNLLDRVHIGLDYFDATINRIAAWTIGTRAVLKSLLMALLEPIADLRQWELEGDWTRRLAMMEELRSMPFSSVWDYYCEKQGVPVGEKWIESMKQYENEVLVKRS